FQQVAQIRSATRATATAAAHAEDIAEDVTENVADIAVEAAVAATADAVLERGMAVLVVGRALLPVAQDFVGFLGFLEFFLCIRIVGTAIRVAFHGQAAKRLLEVVVGSRTFDAKNFVIATFAGHVGNRLHRLGRGRDRQNGAWQSVARRRSARTIRTYFSSSFTSVNSASTTSSA